MFKNLFKKKVNQNLEVGRGIEIPISEPVIVGNRVLRRDETQESNIAKIFKDEARELTRYEVRDIYYKYYGSILDTSLSRSLSCLSKDRTIHMTKNQKKERYGRNCYTYKLS